MKLEDLSAEKLIWFEEAIKVVENFPNECWMDGEERHIVRLVENRLKEELAKLRARSKATAVTI